MCCVRGIPPCAALPLVSPQLLRARRLLPRSSRRPSVVCAERFAQYLDKIQEYKNFVQGQRNFGHNMMSALHMTPAQAPMQHVATAYHAAVNGVDDPVDTGISSSIFNGIDALVEWLTDHVGTDFSTYTESNEMWHTGEPRAMRDPAALRKCRPWDWVWCVAEGRSVGDGMARAKRWDTHAEHLVVDCMFHK